MKGVWIVLLVWLMGCAHHDAHESNTSTVTSPSLYVPVEESLLKVPPEYVPCELPKTKREKKIDECRENNPNNASSSVPLGFTAPPTDDEPPSFIESILQGMVTNYMCELSN